MNVAAAYAYVGKICLQLLCHALGQGCHQHSLVHLCTFANLFQKVVHLILDWPYLDRGVQQSGRAYHLLYHQTL